MKNIKLKDIALLVLMVPGAILLGASNKGLFALPGWATGSICLAMGALLMASAVFNVRSKLASTQVGDAATTTWYDVRDLLFSAWLIVLGVWLLALNYRIIPHSSVVPAVFVLALAVSLVLAIWRGERFVNWLFGPPRKAS